MELLTLEIDKRGVAFVGLNRPAVHNAFDSGLIHELTTLFEQLDSNEEVRLVVIFGHGKSFCAGGDLNWMRSMKQYSREENIEDAKKLSAMYACIYGFSKPLIGVVHGNALGGGSGLAAVCDFVVADEGAKFGFTETRIGILPAVIGQYAMEKIGAGAARAYFISGMQFSASQAKEMGLVQRIASPDELNKLRDEIIVEFLKSSPAACRSTKELIRKIIALAPDREAIADASVMAIVDARVSDEGQEGMDALLSKRKPKWAL